MPRIIRFEFDSYSDRTRDKNALYYANYFFNHELEFILSTITDHKWILVSNRYAFLSIEWHTGSASFLLFSDAFLIVRLIEFLIDDSLLECFYNEALSQVDGCIARTCFRNLHLLLYWLA